MTNSKTYTGGCHCGKVRFEVTADLTAPVAVCNCSICSKTGTMLTFVPAEQFKLVSGESVLTDYQFNKKQVHHLFCSTCGVRSFARGAKPDGTKICAINARCLDGVELDALKTTQFDGRSL